MSDVSLKCRGCLSLAFLVHLECIQYYYSLHNCFPLFARKLMMNQQAGHGHAKSSGNTHDVANESFRHFPVRYGS